MPHFFIKSDDIKNDTVEISDKNLLKHLVLSLRYKTGEKIKLIDENEIQYECVVKKVSKDVLEAQITKKYPSKRKLDYNLCLLQSVLKPDAQGLLISNAAQCGVSAIYPVISDNCAVSLKTVKGKIEKWEKISQEASKQCERANFAHIENVLTLKEALSGFKKENVLIYAEKYANIELEDALKDIDKNKEIAVVTGPEGGFSEAEFDYFKENNYKLISLGNLIFKAPNAVVAGISNIVTRLG